MFYVGLISKAPGRRTTGNAKNYFSALLKMLPGSFKAKPQIPIIMILV